MVHAMNAEQRQTAADLWPNRRAWAIGAIGKLHPPSPFIITQSESLYSFCSPTEGRRPSRPRWLVSGYIRPKSITPVSP